MKELWIEVNTNLSENQKNKLFQSAVQTCDVILVNLDDLISAKKFGLKVASESEESDIIVLKIFGDNIVII